MVLGYRVMPFTSSKLRCRLALVIIGNSFMRIASGASGVLVGLYLADLANHGLHVNAALVGILGAVSFGSELIASVPMGLASDAIAPRGLITGGALLGAIATQLFGMSSRPSIFFLSRTVEGLGAAAVTPSLLSHLTDVTDGNHSLIERMLVGSWRSGKPRTWICKSNLWLLYGSQRAIPATLGSRMVVCEYDRWPMAWANAAVPSHP